MEIVCKGWVSQGKSDVNVSDIFSFLIKEVGTKVTNYASDIYYDLRMIDEAIKECKSDNFLIGLRDSGVDGKEFIKLREERPDIYGSPYINIYSVGVRVSKKEIIVVLRTVK